MNAQEWNPRFLEYCRENGVTDPYLMLKDAHSGGYILWLSARWSEWKSQRPVIGCPVVVTHEEHANFDLWLSKRTYGVKP
jgi:hypothetical protein